MKEFYIYMHKCKINNKVYIGMTSNPKRRWRSKGIEYKPDKYNTKPFWNAICKYGWDNFEHIIIEENLTKEQAEEKEKFYIKEYKSRNKKYGYNVAEGGEGGRIYLVHPKGMLGKHQTEFQIENQKKIMLTDNPMTNGQVIWGETHEHPKGMLGKEHSKETKNHISDTMKSKNINCKPVLVIMPNGDKYIFKSQTEASSFLGISSTSSVFLKCWKTGLPYKIKGKNKYTKNLQHLEGLIIKTHTDNTEITIESKDSIAS